MDDISKIYQSKSILPNKPNTSSFEKKKHKKRKRFQEAKKHFNELTKIVDEAHKELEKNESPFRLCVYQENNDIFIDIVTIDESGKIDQIFKHNITHVEFENLVQHIKNGGRGLILDADI